MMKNFVHLLCMFLIWTLCASCTSAGQPADQPEPHPPSPEAANYQTERVVDDLSNPWGMSSLPNGDMLITARSGALYRYRNGNRVAEIENIPNVWAQGQGGLLDVAVHPNYDQNGWIYFTYSSPEGGGGAHTALMRAQLSNDGRQLINNEMLYKGKPNTARGQHFGSRIVLDGNGFVYFGIGDRGQRTVNPQDLSRDGGKIYRLHADGRIPTDNPFVGDGSAKPAVFAYGIRNPQGMALNPSTGDVWEHEHGPKGGDEVNIIRAGNNYGWPIISYGDNYDGSTFAEDTVRAGMEQPIWYWDPSIAPSGMAFVTGERYAAWQGDLLIGSLKFNYVVHAQVNGNRITGTEIVFDGIGRVRDIKQGPDGYIYIATEGDGIHRITTE